jgi:hypothetical protein
MIVFVSDIFAEDYVGGAELTTEGIITGTDLPLIRVRSQQVNPQVIEALKDRYWVFGNFSGLSPNLILECTQKLTYSIIEYDYKFCKFRLPEKHVAAEGVCNCHQEMQGKLISLFYHHAQSLWFMSAAQMNIYLEHFPFLQKDTTEVLSSIFDPSALDTFSRLKSSKKSNKWLIQDSDSWVKGTEDAIKYAKDNGLPYETFKGISYEEMLAKFSTSKGFIFLPRGGDTCPRTVIEAKMLGCELVLNDNVQHKDEEWFSGTVEDSHSYLSGRVKYFWNRNHEHMPYNIPGPTGKAESTHFKIIVPSYNCEEWIDRTIRSIRDQEYKNYECVIIDDISTDGTWNKIQDQKLGKKFITIKNNVKKYALRNIHDALEKIQSDPQDVVVLLDGDDWFSNEHTLSTLNKYYQSDNCFMTFGSFVRFPDGHLGLESSEYSPEVVSSASFRQDDWRASHLKTYRMFLWDQLDKKDLQDEAGNFYESCYDQAIMLPLLEMSQDRIKYIPEILCVYNIGNPNAVNKLKVQKQYDTMQEIRGKKPYQRINSENLF